jgi:glycosyltransferase involved in cell wall biosynthesis
MKVTLLIPTFNEIEGLKQIMPQIKRDWCDQVLIVDANSTDGTAEYASDNGWQVVTQQSPGLRHAYLDALPYIVGDVIITFSPDGNSVTDRIPPLIEKMQEGYDMVIVSRYLDDANSDDDTPITALANKVFTMTTNLFFGGNYTDVMVIYRAFKKNLISDLDLDKPSSYRPMEKIIGKVMSWEMLLSIRAAKRELKLGEIPGDEPMRIGGERRMQWRWGFAYIMQIFKEIFYWR